MYNIEDLTEQARRSGASDIHLVCGLPPKYRLDGQLENMAEERLSEKDCDMLCQDLAKDAMYEKLEYTGELDFSREIRGIRCRCHVFKQQGKVSAAIRLLSESIPRLDSLGLPPSALEFTSLHKGIVLVTGETGSGKSTIAKLMAGFWDVTSGSVRFGGQDIRQIPFEQLMGEISYVAQDNFLFDKSFRENIRMGNPAATDEEVEDAAKAANCHDFIMQLEQGYDTLAGNAGDRLSGGERQRITIARAMLKPSSVVILDEATAYADPENEALIQQAISKLVAGKTLIVVAHRLNTIRNADQILVVANGNIAGRGTQEELLRECPIYQKMWQDYAGTIEEADLKGGVENHA